MTDYDHIPIETTEGRRQPSPAADRILVGMAAVALSAGLLIALGNLFGGDDGVSVASESPDATAGPSRTQRPSPSPRPRVVFSVEPGAPPPSTRPEPQPFNGWIRASADLVLHTMPDPEAPEAGVLAAGSAAFAEEWPDEPGAEAGWLHVSSPTPDGWIATVDANGSELIQRFTQPPTRMGAAVWDLVAGPEGFLAIGSAPARSDEMPETIMLVSADGARWRSPPTPPVGWGGASVAWGPAGWLAAGAVFSPVGSGTWLWRSDDGLRWSLLGSMAGLPSDTYPGQLVASERGYLLTTDSYRRRGSPLSLWFSVDGITWQESADLGIEPQGGIQTAATPMGFFAWDAYETDIPSPAAFSLDGRTWSAVVGGPSGQSAHIGSLPDRIIGIDSDPDTGSPRVWTGAVARDQIAWLREPDAEPAFADSYVSGVVSDGRRVLAVGWDRSTEAPLTWSLDGGEWTRSPLPRELFGSIPRLAAAGPAGFVLVGYRPTLRGSNPVFWHDTDGGSWAAERSPVFDVVPEPTGEECPAPPTDAVEFAVLDRLSAVACFGDAPMTFRAWAGDCEGCYWNSGEHEPSWLAGVSGGQLYLSPITNIDYLGGPPAVIHPSLEYDPGWTRQWLDVTGHFDDPASIECRWTPAQSDIAYYEGRWTTVSACRQQFVVTAVTVVEFPT